MRARLLFPLALAILVSGCHPDEPESSIPIPALKVYRAAPPDPWLLTCIDPTVETPALLWNGLIGVRIGRDGTGGGPLFSIDAYEQTGEEKIIPLPNLLTARWSAGKTELKPASAQDYKQVLDMKTGLLTTSWSQKVDGVDLRIQSECAIDPNQAKLVQKWRFEASGDLQLESFAEIPGAVITKHDASKIDWTITANKKHARETVTNLRVDVNGNAERLKATVSPGKPFTCERAFAFDSSAPATPQTTNVADIEIDGPVEDQQAVRSFLFYLRTAIAPKLGRSVSPFGLSNETYNGHVFWDADIWVFPALAFVDPEAARSIVQYRFDHLDQAESNYKQWMGEGRPTAKGKLGATADNSAKGAKFPWESSVTGKETVPGPSKFEEHITGDVAFAAIQAASLGLVPESKALTLANQAATYYIKRSTPTPAGLRIDGVMSPDENHIGDNDLYTNAIADWCQEFGGGKPMSHVLPRDAKTFLTYDNDPLRSYKQAAAVLTIYPLQLPQAEKEARVMMERFADKTSKNGPAMSDSLHALIWARLGESEKGYDSWRKSWMEFVKEPHLQFSEKRNQSTTYFTTGAAGCLQTVIYGFLGFRIDSKKQDGARWSTPLALGRILSVKPNLPPAWKSVKFKNFTVMGRRYTLIATHTGVQVIQGEK